MVVYSSSEMTIRNLIQEYGAPALTIAGMHEGAFRKRYDFCPHCEHKMKNWLRESTIKEVIFMVDLAYGRIISPEEYTPVVCECLKCGKKNIYHYALRDLLDCDFIDHDKIAAEMEKRNLDERGFKKEKTEGDDSLAEIRLTQRVTEAQAAIGLEMFARPKTTDIPDFEAPCGGIIREVDDEGFHTGKSERCDMIWTPQNTEPRWMTDTHLVIRCPKCGCQRALKESEYE